MEERQDLISRQAAIDAVENEMCIFYDCDVLEKLKDLPPAQPNLQPTCNQLATDTISRQDAIDVIMDYPHGDVWNVENMDNMVCEIKALPSAQPEQSIAQERYEDLCEYFKDCSDQGRSILNDRKEFKSWLDRMKWHVMECNKLGRELEKLKTAQPEQQWILCSERLPEDIKPVIVTWKNTDPKSYYQYIVGKHFIGTGHFCNGKWFWYSSTCEDLLAEYGRSDVDEIDEAIEVIAWMPLPEPYQAERREE